jgi:hypothetical protein
LLQSTPTEVIAEIEPKASQVRQVQEMLSGTVRGVDHRRRVPAQTPYRGLGLAPIREIESKTVHVIVDSTRSLSFTTEACAIPLSDGGNATEVVTFDRESFTGCECRAMVFQRLRRWAIPMFARQRNRHAF